MKYSDVGLNVKKIRESQNEIAKELQTTFGRRAGKFGMPISSIGHYAGIVAIDNKRALALHCDGVGTKILVAERMNKHDTIGIDAVAMTVNDLICVGAEPTNLQDYIALSKLDPDLIKSLVIGLRDAAREAHVAIVGGETAILPDMFTPSEKPDITRYDLVTFGVGVLDRDKIIDGKNIVENDAIIGIESSGFHSNGYSLLRKLIFEKAKLDIEDKFPGMQKKVGEVLLTPTKIYSLPIVDLLSKAEIHGIAHITGGAFSKLMRITLGKEIGFDITDFPESPVEFNSVKEIGNLSDYEMFRTFNMGIGMCLVLPEKEVEKSIDLLSKFKIKAYRIGEIINRRVVKINGLKIT
ncbi:MAG: phosphoribosylformylglycinamidine cyclo-ligase [Candidatus Ranarchaeia archaeon]